MVPLTTQPRIFQVNGHVRAADNYGRRVELNELDTSTVGTNLPQGTRLLEITASIGTEYYIIDKKDNIFEATLSGTTCITGSRLTYANGDQAVLLRHKPQPLPGFGATIVDVDDGGLYFVGNGRKEPLSFVAEDASSGLIIYSLVRDPKPTDALFAFDGRHFYTDTDFAPSRNASGDVVGGVLSPSPRKKHEAVWTDNEAEATFLATGRLEPSDLPKGPVNGKRSAIVGVIESPFVKQSGRPVISAATGTLLLAAGITFLTGGFAAGAVLGAVGIGAAIGARGKSTVTDLDILFNEQTTALGEARGEPRETTRLNTRVLTEFYEKGTITYETTSNQRGGFSKVQKTRYEGSDGEIVNLRSEWVVTDDGDRKDTNRIATHSLATGEIVEQRELFDLENGTTERTTTVLDVNKRPRLVMCQVYNSTTKEIEQELDLLNPGKKEVKFKSTSRTLNPIVRAYNYAWNANQAVVDTVRHGTKAVSAASTAAFVATGFSFSAASAPVSALLTMAGMWAPAIPVLAGGVGGALAIGGVVFGMRKAIGALTEAVRSPHQMQNAVEAFSHPIQATKEFFSANARRQHTPAMSV